MNVSFVFQLSYKGVTRVLLGCHKGVSWVLQGCYTGVSMEWHAEISYKE